MKDYISDSEMLHQVVESKAKIISLENPVSLVALTGCDGVATLQITAERDLENFRIVFDSIKLSQGAYLQVFSADYKTSYTYAEADFYSPAGVSEYESHSFKQGEVIVRLVYPQGKPDAQDKVVISHYLGQPFTPQTRAIIGTDQSVHAICYQGGDKDNFYRRSLTVPLVTISGGWGSGWNIAGGPYVVTNHHVAGDIGKKTHRLTYNYASSVCGAEVLDESIQLTIPVTDVVAAGMGPGAVGNDDWAMYKVDELAWEEAGIVPFFGALSFDTTMNNEQVINHPIYIPQHPRAHATKICDLCDDKGTPSTVTSVTGNRMLYNCDTQAGSSGSPVISQLSEGVVCLHRAAVPYSNTGVNGRTVYEGIASILPQSNQPEMATVGKGNIKTATIAVVPYLPAVIKTGIDQPFTISALDASRLQMKPGYSLFQGKGRSPDGEIRDINIRLQSDENSGDITVSVLEEDNTDSDGTLLTGWMALPLNHATTGENLKNLIVSFSYERYDPFASPFDAQADVINLTLTEKQSAVSDAMVVENSNTGFVAVRTGQGPLALMSGGTDDSVLHVPVKDTAGGIHVVTLRGQRRNACSPALRPMNSITGCGNGAKPATLIVSWHREDNPALPAGHYQGILPVVATRSVERIPILINIDLTVK